MRGGKTVNDDSNQRRALHRDEAAGLMDDPMHGREPEPCPSPDRQLVVKNGSKIRDARRSHPCHARVAHTKPHVGACGVSPRAAASAADTVTSAVATVEHTPPRRHGIPRVHHEIHQTPARSGRDPLSRADTVGASAETNLMSSPITRLSMRSASATTSLEIRHSRA